MLVQIISILGARRRELRAAVGERLRLLEARAVAAEPRHVALEVRLARLEGRLERLERARLVRSQRQRMHQLGSVLMYVGGLAVLWVILLELGLALGLS